MQATWLSRPARTATSTRPFRRRCIHTTLPARLPTLQSKRYAPTLKPEEIEQDELTSLGMLVRGGFIRQSSSGVWTLLPNGRRVMDKLERIVRQGMAEIYAEEVSLPSLQPASLWQRTGRWTSSGSELFRISDRKGAQFALAPTHEEEITGLVAGDVQSGKQLPVRLFQIGRKFRDEVRPRAGLLRSKEFVMKDLYTFDATPEAASRTYQQVRKAYDRIFHAIGLPFRAVEADSGNIGGSLSHEYQYDSPHGEDTVVACSSCSYAANVELASSYLAPDTISSYTSLVAFPFASPSTNTLTAVLLPPSATLNTTKLRRHIPDAIEVATGEGIVPLDQWDALRVVIDPSCMALDEEELQEAIEEMLSTIHGGTNAITSPLSIWPAPPTLDVVDLRAAKAGELCPSCKKPLTSHRAIEVAHTFHLGTKYSSALGATFSEQGGSATRKPFEMGCYGIGMSRLLAAIAECSHTSEGLRWPITVSPFIACIIPGPKGGALEAAIELAAAVEGAAQGRMKGEVLVDDRKETLGWKLSDAELVGYPYVAIMAKRWQETGEIEVRDLRRKTVSYAKVDKIVEAIEEMMGFKKGFEISDA